MLINLFNAKNPNGKRVPVTVNLEHVDIVNTNDGELIYLMVLETGVLDINLQPIPPIYINNVTQTSIKEELQKALSILAQQINWGLLEEDIYPPIIEELNIKAGDVNIPINTDLFLKLKDPLPASLINTNTIKLEVNGIDVSNNLNIVEKGNEVFLQWIPIRVYK